MAAITLLSTAFAHSNQRATAGQQDQAHYLTTLIAAASPRGSSGGEATHVAELSRQLDEERRKRAEISAEFARFRDAIEHAPVEDPWGVLWRAVSQIISDWVAWARAKIPPDSPFLSWFDRAVELAKAAGRLAWRSSKAVFEWAKPRVIDLWKRLKSEVARRTNKE